MNPSEPPLINSQPLRINAKQSQSKTESELEEIAYEAAAYTTSSGLVTCYQDGNGEVLVSESFDDVGLHFIFTRTTNLQYSTDHDPLGIGSVVQIYWTRSFERVVRGSHIIVQIEKMEIYKCAPMLPERVFVTFNAQNTPGIAIGVTERSITVAFHPICAPKNRYETLKAFNDGRTEFEMLYKHHENTNRMVEVILAAVPFRVEIKGNVDKVPFIVIQKRGYAPGKEGVAVITKILRHHFMEAYFLQSSDRVYFDSKSCHSNILEKVSVGSLINVLASPTFKSSQYKWYGYDVTMCNNYLANRQTQKSFVMENNEILQNHKDRETPTMKYARSAFQQAHVHVKDEAEYAEEAKKKKPMNLFKFDSKTAQYKLRHLILDKCFSTLDPRKANALVDSYFPERLMNSDLVYNQYGNIEHRRRCLKEDVEEENPIGRGDGAKYSESLQNGIKEVLEPFGLNRPQQKPNLAPKPAAPLPRSSFTSGSILQLLLEPYRDRPKKGGKKKTTLPPKLTPEEVRHRFGWNMDANGYALNQRAKDVFDLPDSKWNPTERRWIGLYDDVQHVMMATFCPIPDGQPRKELLGGFWYRRTVPREEPIGVVERLETRRNILKDCTESLREDDD